MSLSNINTPLGAAFYHLAQELERLAPCPEQTELMTDLEALRRKAERYVEKSEAAR